ncbi:hypothetical protein SUGI_0492500 [Cryptomeria japonica]|nr:hypothetical protein SUGI_0492500 [Cryptomeria japonica]
MGRMMLRFKSLSRIVVHKQRAASISKTPCRTGQHVFTAGSPMVAFTSPPRTSTHAPNFNAFSGQFPPLGELGGGGDKVVGGGGGGGGGDEVVGGGGGDEDVGGGGGGEDEVVGGGGGDEVVGGGGGEEYEVLGGGGGEVFLLGGGGGGQLASTAATMMLAKQTITITSNTAPFLIFIMFLDRNQASK